jgi:UDP-N-acetylglucosamine 2-epimerase (non-hydrolysing)
MRVLSVFGTRPEAIKMAPVLKALQRLNTDSLVCVTAQHREMLDSVLQFFDIVTNIDLDLMRPGQSLPSLTSRILEAIDRVLEETKPHIVLVQGDTTTAMAAALAAFYRKISVGHVEAGLRSYDLLAPFPEEMNRILVDVVSQYYFAPTPRAAETLRREIPTASNIYVTGNTSIDALLMAIERLNYDHELRRRIDQKLNLSNSERRLILVTGHRRESFGKGFEEICRAIKTISQRRDVEIVYPVHLNPNVRDPVHRLLGDIPNIKLLEPVDYPTFVRLMQRAYLILTDSGGIQEEAPTLNKPVLVMRSRTERQEGVAAGAAELVGTDHKAIVRRTHALLDDSAFWNRMAAAPNPYGDGHAAEKICRVVLAAEPSTKLVPGAYSMAKAVLP